MRIIAKTMIALGILGATAMGPTVPALAQGFYVQAPGFGFSIGQRYYGGAWAYDGRMNRRFGPRARAERGWHHWDPYGLRWD